MWSLDNRTPYKVGRGWGRDKQGVHEWIVAVKGTFDIVPGGVPDLSSEQLSPLLVADYAGKPGRSSVLYEADILPQKPTTDITLNATAYAPNGRPSTSFPVTMTVGSVQKALRVIGDRRWMRTPVGLAVTETQPVRSVPIRYERAYGGYDDSGPDVRAHRIDLRNPVGRGIFAESGRASGQPLHNFEYPSGSPEKSGPAGFGALDSHWSPRREYAGTYDLAWQQTRSPLLAADWDPRSLQCAPRDQQPSAHLRGGELVQLVNLTPNGRLSFVLPKAYFTFTTRIRSRKEEHRSRLTSVIIEPDANRLIMVWTSTLACPTDVDYLEETTIRLKPFLQ